MSITGYLFFALLAIRSAFNPLNSELNPICHLLALLGANHIFHVSGLRVKSTELYITRPRNFAEILTVLVYVQNAPIPIVDCNSGCLYPAFFKAS